MYRAVFLYHIYQTPIGKIRNQGVRRRLQSRFQSGFRQQRSAKMVQQGMSRADGPTLLRGDNEVPVFGLQGRDHLHHTHAQPGKNHQPVEACGRDRKGVKRLQQKEGHRRQA